MKKKWALLLLISLTIIMTVSLAENFLPPLNELFDTEMPSIENALHRQADETESLPDGIIRMVFLNCGRNEYNACSEYLGTSGCQVVNTTREGKAISVVLEKEGRTFTFSYYSGEDTIIVLYPEKTFVEAYNIAYNYKDVKKGDIITFGTYPQTASGTDSSPIEWLVLESDMEDKRAFLISRYGLDTKPYNNVPYWGSSWQQCALRAWLNNDFYHKAFSEAEQRVILETTVENGKEQQYSTWYIPSRNNGNTTFDKIFLLSYAEANRYFDVTRENDNNQLSRISPTPYAIENNAYISKEKTTKDGREAGWWWLRSYRDYYDVASVRTDGSLSSTKADNNKLVIRPAMWISIYVDPQ